MVSEIKLSDSAGDGSEENVGSLSQNIEGLWTISEFRYS